MSPSPSSPNPRVAAGKRNRQQRGPLTDEGRERLRQAALANRPWERSTGPRSAKGKARAARNGKLRQRGERSARVIRRSLAELTELTTNMAAARQLMAEALASRR